VNSAREGLLALSVGVGLGVLAELMEEEVDEVVGPKGRHNPRTSEIPACPHPARKRQERPVNVPVMRDFAREWTGATPRRSTTGKCRWSGRRSGLRSS
jgi:hypothetical protein